jgi:hypothetical protein
MASNFPGALDNIAANKTNATVTENDHPDHHNELADAINAVQTALGVNLSGAVAAAPVQSVAGRTGTVTLAKADVGLGNVDNTSDANKPVSTAQAAADTGVQSFAVQRSNHTGTQTASTISDFATAAATAAPVQSVAGLTGAVTLAKADVGLSNVDNTSDANKPVSTATQTALDAKVGSVTTGITGADAITNMVSLTQAEYDDIGTKSATTFYVIAG